MSAGGVSGVYAGKKYGFGAVATDAEITLGDADTDAIVVVTRHDSHADYICRSLQNRKHVFVEKPLTTTQEQLEEVISAYQACIDSGFRPLIMVGFNRRFAPQIARMKALLDAAPEPKSFVMTVNSGEIPAEHWTQDRAQGGGRIIGEACHFIDLLRFLAGHSIAAVHAVRIGSNTTSAIRDDKATITLEFADGSFGSVHYLANGHRSLPKERLEVFCGGRVLQLNNFRKLRGYGWGLDFES